MESQWPLETAPADEGIDMAAGDEQSGEDGLPRERLVERFRVWLSEALAEEPAPAGIAAEIWAELEAEEASAAAPARPPEARCDLYAMWSALTSLTQEVRLQGRAFKQVHDSLGPVTAMGEALEETIHAHQEAMDEARRLAAEGREQRLEHARERQREIEQQARRGMIDLLLSMRERLLRGLETIGRDPEEAARGGWKAKIFGVPHGAYLRLKEGVDAIEQGCRLSLDHLNEALAGYGLREIACEGRLFDPRTMEAVDSQQTPEVAPGTVLAVYQRGYEWDGRLYRVARVKVAMATMAAAKPAENNH